MTVLERSHHRPRLASVGTAVPPHAYSQQDVLAWSSETDPKIRRLFRNSHIESRRLYLPEPVDGEPPEAAAGLRRACALACRRHARPVLPAFPAVPS